MFKKVLLVLRRCTLSPNADARGHLQKGLLATQGNYGLPGIPAIASLVFQATTWERALPTSNLSVTRFRRFRRFMIVIVDICLYSGNVVDR